MMRNKLWRLRYFPVGVIVGDQGYAIWRLFFVCIVLAFFTFIGGIPFEIDKFNQIIDEWRKIIPSLEFIPNLFLYPFTTFFTFGGMRYLIVPLMAIIFALLVGAHYVQDIYELPDFRHGLNYLISSIFGLNYSKLKISKGKKSIKAREINLVDVIGGPGFIKILPGNVVLFERLSGPANVYSAGKHFIPRGELIREICSLDDQNLHMEEILATTRDGIEIVVRDVNLGFRLRLGHQLREKSDRTPFDPYPFSVQAIRNRTYNRFVSNNGLISWHDSVLSAVKGVIVEYINRHTIDQLTAPLSQEGPREELKIKLFSKGTRESLRLLGAELLWVDIGHFDIPDKVTEQRVKNWQVKWQGIAKRERAEGEAKRLADLEQGRAEAQAELIQEIVKVLEEINVSGDKKNMRRLFFARTAQILDAISESSPSGNKKSNIK